MRDVVMNDKTNLLQLEEHFYQLVDVDEPNTFRNLFPDRKSTRLNSSHANESRMPSSA